LIKRILPYLDDISYLTGTVCIAVGLFLSPFPFTGWIAIGASLIYFSKQIAKAGIA